MADVEEVPGTPLKELGFQELLRYALSGGIGVASLLLTYPKIACSVGRVEGAREVTLILGTILLLGTLIYNLHRALLFPVLFRVIGLIVPIGKFKWTLLILYRPSEAEIELDRWRWNLKARSHWDEWGAQVHFLYCAAWAILATLTVGNCVAGPPNCRAWRIFLDLFFFTFGAGIVHHFRLLSLLVAERRSHAGQKAQ
jgi:hypothetical protein